MKEFKSIETMPFMATFDYNMSVPIKPAENVLRGLKRGHVGALCAEGWPGKSFLMMELAMELATGRCGAKGATLYFDFGNPWPFQALRQDAIFEALYTEADIADLSRNLHVVPKDACRIDMIEGFDKARKDIKRILENRSAKFGCEFKLVAFDPLSFCHAEDENDNRAMALLLNRLRQIAEDFDVAVMFVHSLVRDESGCLAMRGSPVLDDGVKFQIHLVPLAKAEARDCRDVTGGANEVILPEDAGNYLCARVARDSYGPAMGDARWYRRSGETGVLIPANLEWRR